MHSESSITSDHMFILLGAASHASGSAPTPQPQYIIAMENNSAPMNGSVGKMKVSEGVSTGVDGSDIGGDHAVGVSGARDNRVLIGGGGNMAGLIRDDDLSPLKTVGERYSIDGKIVQVTLISDKHYSDLDVYLEDLRNKLMSTFTNILDSKHGINFFVAIHVRYTHPTNDQRNREPTILHSGKRIITSTLVLHRQLDSLINILRERNIRFNQERSGLVLEEILKTDLKVVEYVPLAGLKFRQLPPFLASKQAIINVNNTDNRCFGYALLSALHPRTKNPQRPLWYEPLFAKEGLDNIQYPVTHDQIPTIEDKLKICINLFTFWDDEGRARTPVYISNKPYTNNIDLLYWETGGADENNSEGHYAWIKNFSAFMADIKAAKGHKLHWCKKCLGHFQSQPEFELHQCYCRGVESCGQVYLMPQRGKWSQLSFRNFSNGTRAPVVIYADFESLVQPNESNPMNGHKSHLYEHHIPCTVGYKIKSDFPALDESYQVIHGPDCVTDFIRRILAFEKKATTYYLDDKRMIMTHQDNEDFARATICRFCHQPFNVDESKVNNQSEKKVRDHDHLTGMYRGAAHSSCNLKHRKTLKIPIFFHNFRGYDGHLISAQLAHFKEHPIKVIGQGMEKYLTLSLSKSITFKDSLMFLGASLEQLGKNLRASGMEKFKILQSEFPNASTEQLDLLLRKQVYPYEYMDSWDRFCEFSLPPKEAFFNKLRDQSLSDDEYDHAQKVWSSFGCKTMLDYHHIYLKCMFPLLNARFVNTGLFQEIFSISI